MNVHILLQMSTFYYECLLFIMNVYFFIMYCAILYRKCAIKLSLKLSYFYINVIYVPHHDYPKNKVADQPASLQFQICIIVIHCFVRIMQFILAPTRESLTSLYASNKGTDQPAHPCSLVSAFVIRSL